MNRSPTENLAEALRGAYPGAGGRARRRRRARLPGRRRRPRPAARPRPLPTSTWSSSATPRRWPPGSAPRCVEHERFATAKVAARRPRGRHRHRPHRDLPASRRAAGGRARPPTSRPTSAAATSRSTRWRSPLGGEAGLIDPHGGRADLEAGLLRVLHPGSFDDDPTRAIRAARYAARLGFALEPETEALLRAADLEHGLGRPPRGRAAAAGGRTERAARPTGCSPSWGLVELRDGGVELASSGRASCSSRRSGQAARRARPGRARGRAGPSRAASGRWPASEPCAALGGGRAGRRPRPGRARRSPGRCGAELAGRLPARSGARSSSRSAATT